MLGNKVERLKTVFIAYLLHVSASTGHPQWETFFNINRRYAVIYIYFTYFKVTKIHANAFKIIVVYRTPSINRTCPSEVGYLRPDLVGTK
jgi:hypothetical protein